MMSGALYVLKGTISLNGEVIGECKDLKIHREVIEKEPDPESSYLREYEPGPVYIEGLIKGGHFEKGRWANAVANDLAALIKTLHGPNHSPIHLTSSFEIPIFEKGRLIRTDIQEVDLGLFILEEDGNTVKLKQFSQ